MSDDKDFRCKTCDHFRNGCHAPVPFWAEPHGRPRIYSEDSGCDVHTARTDLCADPALLAEAVEVLRTLRDYVDDASRGTLRYRGKSDISEMAGDDLVLLDNVIAKLEARHDR